MLYALRRAARPRRTQYLSVSVCDMRLPFEIVLTFQHRWPRRPQILYRSELLLRIVERSHVGGDESTTTDATSSHASSGRLITLTIHSDGIWCVQGAAQTASASQQRHKQRRAQRNNYIQNQLINLPDEYQAPERLRQVQKQAPVHVPQGMVRPREFNHHPQQVMTFTKAG